MFKLNSSTSVTSFVKHRFVTTCVVCWDKHLKLYNSKPVFVEKSNLISKENLVFKLPKIFFHAISVFICFNMNGWLSSSVNYVVVFSRCNKIISQLKNYSISFLQIFLENWADTWGKLEIKKIILSLTRIGKEGRNNDSFCNAIILFMF